MRRFNRELMRSLRRDRGLRQEDLAAMIGRARTTISEVERGDLKPGADMVRAIAPALGVDEEAMYTAAPALAAFGLPDDEQTLLRAFRQAPRTAQAAILSLTTSLSALGQ